MLGPFALCLLNLLFEEQWGFRKGSCWHWHTVYDGMAPPVLQMHCRLHEDDLLALQARTHASVRRGCSAMPQLASTQLLSTIEIRQHFSMLSAGAFWFFQISWC